MDTESIWKHISPFLNMAAGVPAAPAAAWVNQSSTTH